MDVDLGHLTKPCACGEDHDITFPEIYIEAGAVTRLEDILDEYQNPVFICDSNTRVAAEPFLEEEFKDYPVIELDPEGLCANEKTLNRVLRQVEYCEEGCGAVCVDVLVAIGAGTIHDFTRYCAKEYGVEYISVPTAASCDGFASNVAAVMDDGVKKYWPADRPKCILADTDILTKAPYALTAAGISDMMGRYIALLDWKVANLVTDEYICEEIVEWAEKVLKDVVRDLDDIRAGEEEATEKLMYALIMSSLFVQMSGTSRAASGAEHKIAQLMDMLKMGSEEVLHGDKVAVGLVLALEYYKELAERIDDEKVIVDNDTLKGLEYGLLEEAFGDGDLLEDVLHENEPNPLEDIDLEDLEEKLEDIEKLVDKLPDVDDMIRKLKEAGCKTSLAEIGIPEEKKEWLLQVSPYVSNRVTLMRLAKLFEYK